MKKTVHLIYPFNLNKKINPWSIGNNIYLALKDKFYFKNYNWTSVKKINPDEGDILIGHAHSNPLTIFRRSIKNPKWSKKILIQPYNEDPKQISHLYNLIENCDYFLAICGKYWFKRLSTSPFRSWKEKMIQLDLGLDKKQYPFIKSKFNKKGKRKFIYIGNDYSYNNFAKNLEYLKKIIDKTDHKSFASAGNKQISNEKHYGWLKFEQKKNLKIIKNYDFLIQVSKNDANPSIVLESISWGLIPIITEGCGYEELDKKYLINQYDYNKVLKKLEDLQNLNHSQLKKLQTNNLHLLDKQFSWQKFQKKIKKIILEKRKKRKKILYTKKELNYFIHNTKNSPNYFLNPDILMSIVKSNIKTFFNL